MGFAPLVKSCEKLFVKAPFAQTLPKDFAKIIKSSELKLCPNFKGTVGDVAHFTETTFKKPSAEEFNILPRFELSDELEKRLSDNVFKQRFISSYNEFFRNRQITTNYVDNAIINEGDMLHGMSYNPEVLKSILKDGIVSGDVAFVGKNIQNEEAFLKGGLKIICEDGETYGCADFFTSPKNMSIDEYFSYAFREIKPYRRAPEASKLPNKINKRSMAFVVDSHTFEEICPVLSQNSATPSTLSTSPLNGIINHFPYDENLKSVLVGVPSNCISKMIVGTDIKQEEITYIKKIINEMGLKLKLYDISGNIL